MLLSAAVVTPIHYHIEQRDITSSAEDYNESLANIFSFLVRDDIKAFLLLADHAQGPALTNSIRITLDSVFSQLGRDARLLKVKLYDKDGRLIYSTDETEVGEKGDADDIGFANAYRDKVVSSDLTHRDSMTTLHGMRRDINVVATYTPVFGDMAHDDFIGIFEIYSDVTDRESAFRQAMLLELLLLVVVVGIGYAGLLLVIWLGARDIEKAHQARLVLTAKMATLSAAADAKTRLLTSMSHHLKTPLNAIIGFSEMIAGERLGAVGDKRYARFAGDILDSGRRLLRGIDNILDYVRVDSGPAKLFIDMVSPQSVLQSIVRESAETAATAGISVECAPLPPDTGYLSSDPRYLRQALRNLVDNAIRYNRPGGHVWLGAHALDAGRLAFTVADDGNGIREEDLAGIFLPFGSNAEVLTRMHDGFGIGLPLSHRIAESLGGRLTLERRAEGGMLATFIVPREFVAPADSAAVESEKG